MKANRKFVEADEAVSPVIAVILMVAITVVLAATVFVLVSDIGNQGEPPPSVTFSFAADNAANAGAGAINIDLTAGETLPNGQYRVSVMPGRDAAHTFATCTNAVTATGDLSAGERIAASTDSSGGAATCDGQAVAGGPPLADGAYTVAVFHIPSSSVIAAGTVELDVT